MAFLIRINMKVLFQILYLKKPDLHILHYFFKHNKADKLYAIVRHFSAILAVLYENLKSFIYTHYILILILNPPAPFGA